MRRFALHLLIRFLCFKQNLHSYSNPKGFVEAHPFGVRFHKPKNLQMI
jgi:hypothetical protein